MRVLIFFCIFFVGISTNIFAKEINAQYIADLFYKMNGDEKNPTKKINHTKGFCTSGKFIVADNINEKINIPILRQKEIQAEIRYSLGGGNPKQSDKTKTRGMSIKLTDAKGEVWDMVMLNTIINFASNKEDFVEFFESKMPTIDGKIDKVRMEKFNNSKVGKKYLDYINTIGVTKSFANTSFFAIHAFGFDTKNGMKNVKIRFEPQNGVIYLSNSELANLGDNYLKDNFIKEVKKYPIKYNMYIDYANEGDPIDDTTAFWNNPRKSDFVGTLIVEKIINDNCNQDVFFPGILPTGIKAPIDELFDLRDQVYAITFGKRQIK